MNLPVIIYCNVSLDHLLYLQHFLGLDCCIMSLLETYYIRAMVLHTTFIEFQGKVSFLDLQLLIPTHSYLNLRFNLAQPSTLCMASLPIASDDEEQHHLIE